MLGLHIDRNIVTAILMTVSMLGALVSQVLKYILYSEVGMIEEV
jgi:hypothetical protein